MLSYQLYRVAGWLMLLVQLSGFATLVDLHNTPDSVVASWSWWAICAPLYLPLLVALFLVAFAYLLGRINQILYPTPEPDGTNY
ncbi:hypothetical protein [Spirosoma sp. 48-14]|uniref:hypothetical protein n=1 Tax=Spirosoma sp. 48-14 TaxID=1895854 RepID=UPI00095EDE56|nr:hypothetical protein [Spirosoma sp. 48-14]OJW76327.1 MAG: hypothetical protein BGO59_22675 [Spirosoma sp. 48-14]